MLLVCHVAAAFAALHLMLVKGGNSFSCQSAALPHTAALCWCCALVCCIPTANHHAPVWPAGAHLQPHIPAILQALSASSSHPSSLVQTASLAVIEPLLPYINAPQVPAFHSLLAALLPCAQAAIAAHNEELVVQLCQVLVEVAECPAPLLQPCLQQVLEMCMTVATNKQFGWDTREQALHLLVWMAK